MKPIYFDTETCGLTGPIVLLQYAEGGGEIILFCPWEHSVNEVIELFEKLANHPDGVIGFNLAFDWFHIYQMWTVLKLLQESGKGDDLLMDLIREYALFEPRARDYPQALKPVKCCDVMLHARRGPYQSTMDRGDIIIRRVPTPLAWQLASELDARVPLKDIYFARKKDKRTRWQVFDIETEDGMDPDFKNVVLKFAPSSALKALAADALNLPPDKILLFADVEPKNYPTEYGFAPFAMAVGGPSNWNGAWPEKIDYHISWWQTKQLAREYARKDVDLTRRLYIHFGSPELGDDDSELTTCVACVRWRGYKVDLEGIKKLKKLAQEKKFAVVGGKRIRLPTAPRQVRAWIMEVMDPNERAVAEIRKSTKRVLLETMSKRWTKDCDCVIRQREKSDRKAIMMDMDMSMSYEDMMTKMVQESPIKPLEDCPHCRGTGLVKHPAGIRAQLVLAARKSDKEEELYDKILLAGRFHASFKVIGTLSSRMSGADGLNPQGIKNDFTVRSQFPLALGNMELDGGDFAGFEVTLAEAVYNDPLLRKDLLTCENCEGELVCREGDFVCSKCGSQGPCPRCPRGGPFDSKCSKCKGTGLEKYEGKAIHALFGVHVFPDMTYVEIKKTKGTADDRYTRSKQAVFAMFYGGVDHTLKERLGVPIEVAQEAIKRFHNRYRGVARAQAEIDEKFCSMRQPGGLGSQVVWHEPSPYIESMFGFKRYFILENMICKALFDLAQNPPKEWRSIQIKVRRRDREQTVSGAVQSALFGAAFQLQAGNKRAATNHVIQCSGAQITKRVQRKIWDVQPSGAHDWLVQPCNIHDEVLCPTVPQVAEKVGRIVRESVESFRPKVPLIKMEWKRGLRSWAEKG